MSAPVVLTPMDHGRPKAGSARAAAGRAMTVPLCPAAILVPSRV
jgi:hypothetical protein